MILISDAMCLIQNYNSICPAGTASRLSVLYQSLPYEACYSYWSDIDNVMCILV